MRRVKRIHQAETIRDNALEKLLELVEVPLPEAIVQSQVDAALHNAIHPFDHDEDKLAEALEAEGSSREKFDADNREAAEKAVKTQLLMDAIADKLDIQVGQNDLTERVVLMSRQYGIEPQAAAAAAAAEQPAAGGVRRRPARTDRGCGGRGRHHHRHRRQRGGHQRVLRHPQGR